MNPALKSILVAAGAAVASFFLITLLVTFFLLCRTAKHRHRRRRGDPYKDHRTAPNSTAELTSVIVDESATFDPVLNQISMEELRQATKNFSADLIVGDGSFGLVYKADLVSSAGVTTVAIKKLDPDAFQGFREFQAEMETLGKLRHPNIVQILGYCISGADRVLIYEFMERGSLDQWIHDTSSSNDLLVMFGPLTWDTRIKVVRGVANGLRYLHCLDTPIIHRDIKASNVLLDNNFEAHIADFGLARMVDGLRSHVSTQVAGTMGYMPPEYKDGVTAATVQADVYSFGILMFEILTGERPNLPKALDGKEMGLIEWVRKMLGRNQHMEMLDSRMAREGVSEDKVKQYCRIATMCTNETNRARPLMHEVVELLHNL